MNNKNKDRSRTRISRREFLRLSGIAGGMVVLAACGNPPAAPTADKKITLTFWTPGGSEPYCKGFNTIAGNYEERNPNVEIAEVQCGTGEQDFKEVLLARIAAGNPPDATILWDSPIALGARGSLVPLDERMQTSENVQEENWPQAVLASCQFGGKTYGLPATAGSYGIWYNQEWFDKKGIPSSREDFPKTWDELRRLSKEFTHWDGDRLETAGFIPWNDQYTLPIWSALNGSQIYDAANRRYTIDAEPNIELMEYAVAWLDEEYKGDISKVNQSGAWSIYPGSEGQPPAFQEQRLAILELGSWGMGDLYASVPPQFEEWNVAPYPIGPNGSQVVSGYWPNWLVIPQGSQHAEEAFKWLDYLSVEGVRTWFSIVGDLPANKKVPRDLVLPVVVEKRGETFARDVMDFFLHQLEIATPMWDSPVQDFATDQLARAIERIMNKVASPKDALAEAQQANQSELDKLLQST